MADPLQAPAPEKQGPELITRFDLGQTLIGPR